MIGEQRTVRQRFTPTCVGTTSINAFFANGNTVYPHVRGDDPIIWLFTLLITGLPPRAWGRPSTSSPTSASTRFTPTCVGTTQKWVHIKSQVAVYPHVRGDDL